MAETARSPRPEGRSTSTPDPAGSGRGPHDPDTPMGGTHDHSVLRFPVLCLGHDGSICVAWTPEELRRCRGRALWRNRYYEGLIVFDADARPCQVTRAEPDPPLSTPGRWFRRAFNRPLSVRVQMQSLGTPSLAAARAWTVQWLERRADFWEAGGEPIEAWKSRVSEAPDMETLSEIFRDA